MKKLKLFLCVALFGAIGFGAFSTYERYTMTAEEKALLENVEALTQPEHTGGTANKYCPIWDVKYSPTFPWPTIECNTGGSWKCENGKCPHE